MSADPQTPTPYSIIRVARETDWSVLHDASVLDKQPDWGRIESVAPRLEATAWVNGLLGLSALQVGVREPFFWMDVTYRGRDYRSFCVSPKIVERGGRVVQHIETSASLPEQPFAVPRATEVVVEFMTLDRIVRRKELEGMVAFVFQHLYDHCAGVVVMDKGEPAAARARKEVNP
jgi:peptide deformylase